MVSGINLQTLKDSGKFPCAVCRKGTGDNSIYCNSQHWVHKKCSGIKGTLVEDPTFKCSSCTGVARPIDVRRGELYISCVRRTMLHGSECWAVTRETTLRMQRNDRAMMRWICNVRLKDQVNSDILLARLNIPNLTDILRQGRLRWFGHVHHQEMYGDGDG